MAIETVEIIGAAYWASALINGDWSGLDDSEAATLAAWIDRELGGDANRILDVERDDSGDPADPFFTWNYDLYTGSDFRGGDCLVYIALAD